eukprot:1846600-Rhodomonas_salina.1
METCCNVKVQKRGFSTKMQSRSAVMVKNCKLSELKTSRISSCSPCTCIIRSPFPATLDRLRKASRAAETHKGS